MSGLAQVSLLRPGFLPSSRPFPDPQPYVTSDCFSKSLDGLPELFFNRRTRITIHSPWTQVILAGPGTIVLFEQIQNARGVLVSQSYEETDASHVLTMEEITNLTEEGGKPADTLMNVVALIASRFRTDVCSAYLLQPDRSNLVLAASLGLHPRCIGTLRMPLNEGLAGLVAETVMPVAVEDASLHPASNTSRNPEKRSTTPSLACL